VAGPIVVVVGADERTAEAWLPPLAAAGWRAVPLLLSAAAVDSDREALAELERGLARLQRDGAADGERLGVVGSGRAGTLAFLLGCTRRLAAVVDVEGPVLHPHLSRARPTQPLELALNLEGRFLGLFGAAGPVGAEERQRLAARLEAAARPHELVVFPGGEIVVDPGRSGYDGERAKELWRRVLSFLDEALRAAPD
jgi:dienelactone hydrolase